MTLVQGRGVTSQKGHNIPVKITNYPPLYWWMNSSNFKGMQLNNKWPWDCKFGKSLILAWLSLPLVSYTLYYGNYWLSNKPDMSSVLACFLRQFGYYTSQVYYAKVKKVRRVKEKWIKNSFNFFFVFCLLQRVLFPLLTISLPDSFYQINFYWFYEKRKVHRRNLCN